MAQGTLMPAAARRALALFATVLKGRGRAQDIHTDSCRAYSKNGCGVWHVGFGSLRLCAWGVYAYVFMGLPELV